MVSIIHRKGREGVGGDHSSSLKGGSRSIFNVTGGDVYLGDDDGRWTVCTLSRRSVGSMYITKTPRLV
jgi:hypothetical protein